MVPDGLSVYARTSFNVSSLLPHFEFRVEDVDVEAGVARINVTVFNDAGVVITSVEYCLNWSSQTYIASPTDGAYDEANETVTIVIDANGIEAGEYVICVRASAEPGITSDWATYDLIVRDLVSRYNLIALTTKPFKPMKASDLARAVGPSLQAVWMWDSRDLHSDMYI